MKTDIVNNTSYTQNKQNQLSEENDTTFGHNGTWLHTPKKRKKSMARAHIISARIYHSDSYKY